MAPTRDRAEREKEKRKRKPYQDTHAKFVVREETLAKRHQQLVEAVEYCKTNNCKGKKAKSSGLFPLVNDHRTLSLPTLSLPTLSLPTLSLPTLSLPTLSLCSRWYRF